MALLDIKDLNDILKYVAKQRNISNRASNELERQMNEVQYLYESEHKLSESTSDDIRNRVGQLLKKYADLPTLTEFNSNAHLEGKWLWGGSFGVSTIVGTVFLKTWADVVPPMKSVVREIFMFVLETSVDALEHPEADDEVDTTSLMERILPRMSCDILQDGLIVSREQYLQANVSQLLQLMAATLTSYGVLEFVEDGEDMESQITPLGYRVYKHLKDVEEYVQEVADTYARLKKSEAP